VRPPDRTHRSAHRLKRHLATASCNPRLNAIAQSCIGFVLGVPTQPIEIDDPRIVSAARLELDAPRLPIASENSTDRCSADPKHLRRR
jgi:hypothetical protein